MPARTNDEMTTWRTNPHTISVWTFVHRPPAIFKALVNQASFTYPITSVTFDTVTVGAYTDIEEGQTLLIGTTEGADDLGRVRVKKTNGGTIATSTVINFGRAARGTNDGEVNLADNAYITVLDMRLIWGMPPRITDSGTQYKDGDITFGNNKSMQPVANAGPDVLKIVELDTDTALVDFGQTPSYQTHPDATASLTYAWDFKDGTPNTSSSATPTGIEFPVGRRYVKLSVTDSLGNTSSAWALVVIADKAHADLLTKYRITSHRERADGQTVTLILDQDLPADTYPDGTEVLICAEEKNGGSVAALDGPADRKHMLFAGWIDNENHDGTASNKGFIARMTLNLIDVAGRLGKLRGFTQLIQRKASPSKWFHQKKANQARYEHHLLQWHGNTLTRADYTWSGTGETYAFPTFSSDGSSLYDQVDIVAQAIRYKLTCDPWGRLASKPDPIIQPVDDRTATVIASINNSDWTRYSYSYTRTPRYHWSWGEAIKATAKDASQVSKLTTYFCVAPGSAPGQGLNENNTTKQITIDQDELNETEGHRYAARMNARYGYLTLDMARNGQLGVRPAYMEWVKVVNTTATKNRRGRYFTSNDRWLPIEISYTYDLQNGVRKQSWTLEKEVQGTPAQTYTQPASSTQTTFPAMTIVASIPQIVSTNTASIKIGLKALGLVLNDFTLALSWNFDNPADAGGPNWVVNAVSGSVAGASVWVVDARMPTAGFIASTVGGTYRIHRVTGINTNSPAASLLIDTMANGTPNMDFSFEYGGAGLYGVAISRGSGRVKTYVTEDGGVTWGSAVDIVGTTAALQSGLFLDSRTGYIYAAGPSQTVSGGYFTIWRSTNKGVTFTEIGKVASGTDDYASSGDDMIPDIYVPYAGLSKILFHASYNNAGIVSPNQTQLRRWTIGGGHAAWANVSPVYGGYSYGPSTIGRFAIGMASRNLNRMLLAAHTYENSTKYGVFYSGNIMAASPSWSTAVTPDSAVNMPYRRAVLLDDLGDAGLLFGNDGAIAYYDVATNTVDDRKGDLVTTADVIGAFGLVAAA